MSSTHGPDDRSTTEVRPLTRARERQEERALLALRQHTPARIALGRRGVSLPTAASLDFELAHAQARDAVHAGLDVEALRTQLQADGWTDCVTVTSQAPDRVAYLARPDWGRRLAARDATALAARRADDAASPALVIVAADGLSALATQNHVPPLLRALRDRMPTPDSQALVTIATQARVALGDEIGAALKSQLVLVLIGERPGLSSADSLGAYLTWAPQVGRRDAERNCISNIRPGGLGYDEAARQIAALVMAMQAGRCSGVALGFDAAKAITGSRASDAS